MEGSSSNRADYLSDGLHLSERLLIFASHEVIRYSDSDCFLYRGCAQLFAAIKSTILEHFPSWNPETMNMDWPEWSKFESSLRN